MKKTTWHLGLVLAIITMLIGCVEDLSVTDPSSSSDGVIAKRSLENPCGTKTFTLWAGQDIDAGTVVVSNDESNLYVTVTATYGFQSEDENIKMWLGTNLEDVNGGGTSRPSAGLFPDKWKVTVESGNTYTYTVPLNTISTYDATKCGEQPIYVLVHVDILVSDGSGQTAWSGDTEGPGNAWWYYGTFTPSCCDNPPPPVDYYLETAFAKGGYVFTTNPKSNPENLPSLNLTKNRWGWAFNLTETGEYKADIYAGAGLNKTNNGILVGTATIDWTGNKVTVTYDLTDDFLLEEIHIYAGDDMPTTLAPGQYGNLEYFDPFEASFTTTIDLEDTNNDGIWLILHAVVAIPEP